MNILVIGSGGREHALVWKLSQSPKAEKIFALPGNSGIAELAECVPDICIEDIDGIVRFAKQQQIGLAVIGPEVPLTLGAADALTAAGIPAFGPTKAAAEIEGSKSFAKNIMKRYGIPTARYEIFGDPSRARVYVRQMGVPLVIKADGLAAGKGVVVAQTVDEALEAIQRMMDDKAFGAAGSRVVIEEFMEGEEASLLAFTDGKTIVPMIASQDHKRIFDGDQGANTGGMGTYAPAPVMTEELLQQAEKEILEPMLAAMEKEGRPYKGCLYAGLMITEKGPKVVEFNVRFGDPETQVVLPLLDGDLVDIMLACTEGHLEKSAVKWKTGAAACVVLAAGGYPEHYEKGKPIRGIDEAKNAGTLIFHAGTAKKDGTLVTAGGRVLGVVGEAENLEQAVKKAYEGVEKIHFEQMHFRRDIAHRALK